MTVDSYLKITHPTSKVHKLYVATLTSRQLSTMMATVQLPN